MATVADLFTKYNCTNCQDDITGIRVHCAECENFDLCLQCFASGAEIGAHLNNHAYQFMDTGTAILSVFRGKGAWTAREEIRLLDAIEQYGFGNWEDISKHIETKSSEDAKEEYVNKFVNGTIGRHTWTPAQSQRPSLVDHTTEDAGPLGASALQRLPPLDITTEEALQLGYMPNRDSFEREYDPTAEQLISTMTMTPEDTEADYLLKLAHVDMYTRRLRERVRRKRLVRDYQLAATFFRNRNYAQQPNIQRDQREFRDRFRVFGQFYTSNEYERLLGSLEREKDLRIRLSELCRYRHNGLTKIDECRHFEQHAAMAQHRNVDAFGHGKTDNTPPNNGSHRPLGFTLHSPLANNGKKGEVLNANDAKSNFIALSSMPHTGDQISCDASLHSKSYLDSCRGSLAPMTMMTVKPTMTKTATPTIMQTVKLEQGSKTKTAVGSQETTISMKAGHLKQQYQRQQLPPLVQISCVGGGGAEPTTMRNGTIAAKPPRLLLNNVALVSQLVENQEKGAEQTTETTQPLSIILRAQLDELKNLPHPLGTNLLSTNEKQLCQANNLPPTMYLSLKTLMLSGAPLSSHLSPEESSLRKFFLKVGWLSH